ncbi:MAG: flavodoxin [Firmicutes bacterium HGW-Firmicutes-12]|nr:MAG: flavodoxin [Firmicutes bacterium HGW-Firmicutes-12]
MSTLLVYATKYGSTEKCSKILAEKFTDEVKLINLSTKNNNQKVSLADYDRVIIGGSIYMGKIQKEIKEYCLKNLMLLKEKKIGLYICCMSKGDTAEQTLNKVFPPELLTSAVAKDYFGGEFNFKKMNFLDKFITKKVTKTDTDVSNIHEDKIDQFAKAMTNA